MTLMYRTKSATVAPPAPGPAPLVEQTGEKEFTVYAWITKAQKADDGYVYLEGYASTFEEDLYGETVQPEAFRDTLAEYMRNPIVLANHRNATENAVGIVVESKVDEKGLRVRVRLSNSPDEFSTSVRTKALEGILRAFSIGGLFAYEGVKIVRVKLLEISIVPIPANPGALFSLAKAWDAVRQLVLPGGKSAEAAPPAQAPANDDSHQPDAEPSRPAVLGDVPTVKAILDHVQAIAQEVQGGRSLTEAERADLKQALEMLTPLLAEAPAPAEYGNAPAPDPIEEAKKTLTAVYADRILKGELI